MSHDVFISHSSADKRAADAACALLETRGIKCWIAPRDIRPGSDWGELLSCCIAYHFSHQWVSLRTTCVPLN
ncbi:MAG: toll/interleukin-1 receptor domain-containing protein [Verrucomicrobia bacterium]|nr:toll/interleukin-1 receptor domain-containing protein [Verrucomicrobiota bacterium]